MAILIDTNILLRLLQPHHPQCQLAERALAVLRNRNEVLHVAGQNLIELWAVATRPAELNGLGMTVQAAAGELATIKRLFSLLPEMAAIYEEWERVVVKYQVAGKNAHDARIVAAMNLHGVNQVLTFNVDDFARFQGILVIHPKAVASNQ